MKYAYVCLLYKTKIYPSEESQLQCLEKSIFLGKSVI